MITRERKGAQFLIEEEGNGVEATIRDGVMWKVLRRGGD
jgi:hypothetical protein